MRHSGEVSFRYENMAHELFGGFDPCFRKPRVGHIADAGHVRGSRDVGWLVMLASGPSACTVDWRGGGCGDGGGGRNAPRSPPQEVLACRRNH